MSFWGKRFKRTKHENLEELIQATKAHKDILRQLEKSPPVVSYNKIDDKKFNLTVEAESSHMTYDFALNEETEIEKRNGEKIKVLFTMPSANVLNQTLTLGEGKIIYLRREFHDNEAKMIVSMDDTDAKATIHFEVVQ